jgi:hypothetical protein
MHSQALTIRRFDICKQNGTNPLDASWKNKKNSQTLELE